MRKIIFLLMISVLFFTTCKKEDAGRTRPGYFILTALKNSSLKSADMVNADSVKSSFNLGDIKASREFYFILSNGGDNPIYDIKIESNNSAFQVAPESISSISGNKTIGNGDFVPLIALGIVHGVQINGVGYTNLLPMNENTATITITGKTDENGETVLLESDFNFSVNAKVMDMQLTSNGNEIDLTKPTGSVLCNLGLIKYYGVANGLSIKNTGNIAFQLTTYTLSGSEYIKSGTPVQISPDESKEITLPVGTSFYELDSDGTITDYTRIQLQDNGKGFFGIEKPY